jgi:hypothetical protein
MQPEDQHITRDFEDILNICVIKQNSSRDVWNQSGRTNHKEIYI